MPSRPARPRPRALIAALALAATAALAMVAPAGAQSIAAPTRTFLATSIPLTDPEIPNPMRGQYAWLGADSQVPGWPMTDVYYRDQVAWSRIEATKGSYDFTWFDNGLAAAGAAHGRFGFRVMAYCPGCWLDATPSWLPKAPGVAAPNWNSATFLASWEALMAALGTAYGNDPRLGWIDVGGYGAYGEWQSLPGEPALTDASARRIITAVVNAFPTKHVVINASLPHLTDLALGISPTMGLRTDCLGEHDMFSLIPTSPTYQQVWKRAPVLSEWCRTSTTSFALGAQQVATYHVSQTSSANFATSYAAMTAAQKAAFVTAMKSSGYRYELRSLTLPVSAARSSTIAVTLKIANVGSAPTYDPWSVVLQLRSATGAIVSSQSIAVDLRTLLPGSAAYTRSLAIPALTAGRYTVTVKATDPQGYLLPLRFATTGRTSDGAYRLGTIAVT